MTSLRSRTLREIRNNFDFLLEKSRYEIVSEGDGMGGGVTYRSAELWVAVEWDRGLPTLVFAPTQRSVGRVDWTIVDHVLRNAEHYEGEARHSCLASADDLAAWLRPRLDAIEVAFRSPQLDATNIRLSSLLAEQGAERMAYWRRRADESSGSGAPDG